MLWCSGYVQKVKKQSYKKDSHLSKTNVLGVKIVYLFLIFMEIGIETY